MWRNLTRCVENPPATLDIAIARGLLPSEAQEQSFLFQYLISNIVGEIKLNSVQSTVNEVLVANFRVDEILVLTSCSSSINGHLSC